VRNTEVRERVRQLKTARTTADDDDGILAGRERLLG
jgi:hypothetical protein